MKHIWAKCWICGDWFNVKIDNGKIVTDCFHSYINRDFFFGWTYEITNYKDNKWEERVCFKNTYYKIVGYTKLQRTIYYKLWKMFHKKKLEYWECSFCNNEAVKDGAKKLKKWSKSKHRGTRIVIKNAFNTP
jgi:transcription elongation factor Elf1